MNYPITPAVRVLRQHKIDFEPFVFDYVEKGGTRHSADVLGVDEFAVIKTLVFETAAKKPLIVLMHGSLQVSTKTLARHLNVRSVTPVTPEKASKLTGYLVGGTSPFGTKTKIPVYAEESISSLEKIYINGGKRGFLVGVSPNDIKKALTVENVKVGIE